MLERRVESIIDDSLKQNVFGEGFEFRAGQRAVSYTHLRAHETEADLVCRLLLEKKLKERIKKIASVGRGALLAKERQKNHLKSATQALAKISGNDLEIISIHVRDALLSIDSLTSETDNEDILGIIFSKFCIGK